MSIRPLAPLFGLALLVATALPARAAPADDARKAAAAKDWPAAAAAWTKALEANPKDREAAIGLAEATVSGALLDYFVPAEEALQSVLEAKPKDREARVTLGELFLAKAKTRSDPKDMELVYADARDQFKKLVEADPKDETAVVGLARTQYWTAFYDDALKGLDAFLAKNQSKGPAYYWEGQVHYVRALDAYRAAGSVTPEVKALFEKARDAYQAAVKADPKNFDAWMQLGYSLQYLGDTAKAEGAYTSAMGLDPESFMPLKGIEALYTYKQDQYVGALEALAKAVPTNAAVQFYIGYAQLVREHYPEAIKAFQDYMGRSKTPNAACTWLGRALAKTGETAKAQEMFETALKANPDDEEAAAGLGKILLQLYSMSAYRSPDEALAAARGNEHLFELAPRNPWIRNNVAFLLRQAADQHKGDPAWKPVVEECTRIYVDAAKLVENQVSGREASIPYARRYDYAGIVNDAGLMFQYYPATQDLDKAETYYIKALQLTDDGYGDTYGNLYAIYVSQKRWQEAYELARDCSQSLTNKDGTPDKRREKASADAKQLLASGKATD